MSRVLVAGIGNPFFGDDAFGVEVVARLGGRLPDDVDVRAFGIRSIDLAHALMDGPEHAILVDAMPRGGAPGTLYLLEPTLDAGGGASVATHGMDPVQVLLMVRAATGRLPRVHVVGCEPAALEELTTGLSAPVEAALEPACRMIEELVAGVA